MYTENDIVVVTRKLMGITENILKGTIGKIMNMKLSYTDLKGNVLLPVRFEAETYSFSWNIQMNCLKLATNWRK